MAAAGGGGGGGGRGRRAPIPLPAVPPPRRPSRKRTVAGEALLEAERQRRAEQMAALRQWYASADDLINADDVEAFAVYWRLAVDESPELTDAAKFERTTNIVLQVLANQKAGILQYLRSLRLPDWMAFTLNPSLDRVYAAILHNSIAKVQFYASLPPHAAWAALPRDQQPLLGRPEFDRFQLVLRARSVEMVDTLAALPVLGVGDVPGNFKTAKFDYGLLWRQVFPVPSAVPAPISEMSLSVLDRIWTALIPFEGLNPATGLRGGQYGAEAMTALVKGLPPILLEWPHINGRIYESIFNSALANQILFNLARTNKKLFADHVFGLEAFVAKSYPDYPDQLYIPPAALNRVEYLYYKQGTSVWSRWISFPEVNHVIAEAPYKLLFGLLTLATAAGLAQNLASKVVNSVLDFASQLVAQPYLIPETAPASALPRENVRWTVGLAPAVVASTRATGVSFILAIYRRLHQLFTDAEAILDQTYNLSLMPGGPPTPDPAITKRLDELAKGLAARIEPAVRSRTAELRRVLAPGYVVGGQPMPLTAAESAFLASSSSSSSVVGSSRTSLTGAATRGPFALIDLIQSYEYKRRPSFVSSFPSYDPPIRRRASRGTTW